MTGQRVGRSGFGLWGNGQRFLQNIQIDSGGHPASYSVGAGGSFPGGKWSRCEADDFPSVAKGVQEWSCTFAALYTCVQCVGVNVTFVYADFK